MKTFALICGLLFFKASFCQELFVLTEPASNAAARSISLKFSELYFPIDKVYDRPSHRIIPQLSVGVTKKWMLSFGGTLSNMNSFQFKKESFFVYTKYRFLSHDELHRHFRMAAFLQASHTNAPFHYDDAGLMGDKTGIEGGLVAAQLLNRFAVSGTVGHVQLLDESRNSETIFLPKRIYQAMNYSVSSGLLVFPKFYSNYEEVNINLYFEILAQQALDRRKYFIDGAPSIQFIFSSNTKLNMGCRFQMQGNADRMSSTSWLISVERNFLNLWSKGQR